jgi:TolA-binding protein
MMRIFLTVFLAFALCNTGLGQNSELFAHADRHYREGMELLNRGKYAAASEAFADYLEHGIDPVKRADARYFTAFCAVRMNRENGESQVLSFIREHPEHAKTHVAYYELAQYKYLMKQYGPAVEYYGLADFSKLPADQAVEGRFRYGYALFSQKEFDRAIAQFEQVKRQTSPYQYAASYYSGYIHFQRGDYERALGDFRKAGEGEAYAGIVPPLVVKVLYKQRKLTELIEYGDKSLLNPGVRPKSDLHLYLGEAYYLRKEWDKASGHYEEFLRAQSARPGPDLLFRIADVEQRTGNKQAAIASFKEVAVANDTLGQLASYYLGNLYVEEGNKSFAQTAYASAKNQAFQPSVREDALFQYGMVSFDLGNYDEAVRAFTEYREQYPESQRLGEADELLTQAYLYARNYDAAIAHFEGLRSKSPVIERAYQKIAYLKGTELFNDSKFPEAVGMFDRSLRYPMDNAYTIKANFWKGEAFSIGNKYQDAVNAYSAVFRSDPEGQSPEYAAARYGIGFCYFNLGDYEKSIPHFRYYVEKGQGKSDDMRYHEAMVRLADGLYATKKYEAAVGILDRIIAANNKAIDYAYFRKGMIYGITGNLESSNRNFDMVLNGYPGSNLYVNSLFQKSQFNFENGHYQTAVDLFSRVIRDHPQSSFVPYALQGRAIAYSNLNQADASVRDYQTIIRQYPGHEIAESALLGLQEALAASGRSSQFAEYLDEFRRTNPQSTQIESIEYESSKSFYFNQNYKEAIRSFQLFIARYPQSSSVPEARFFLADALYADGQAEASLQQYYELSSQISFNRHNRVLQRIAEIELERGNEARAIQAARALDRNTTNRKDQYGSWRVLMLAYFRMNQNDSSAFFARKILDGALVTANAENEALLILGKTAYAQRNYTAAQDYFIAAVNTAKDEFGAEAQYLLARMHYEQQNYRQSIDALFELNRQFAHYDGWLGKSFLLIADNYQALGETFQAKATLESIAQNSPDPAVAAEARKKLQALESEMLRGEQAAPDTIAIDEALDNR